MLASVRFAVSEGGKRKKCAAFFPMKVLFASFSFKKRKKKKEQRKKNKEERRRKQNKKEEKRRSGRKKPKKLGRGRDTGRNN